MRTRLITTMAIWGLLAAASAAALAPVPARAAGGGGGGGDASSGPSARPADPDYTAGVRAIKANEFAKAIPLLKAAVGRDTRNADAYNWLAYAMRRNGDAAGSIAYYQEALAIDPKHKGAHEYIGEAYLTLGDLPKARQHLKALDSICFLPCSEYTDLKKAVEAYEKKANK